MMRTRKKLINIMIIPKLANKRVFLPDSSFALSPPEVIKKKAPRINTAKAMSVIRTKVSGMMSPSIAFIVPKRAGAKLSGLIKGVGFIHT